MPSLRRNPEPDELVASSKPTDPVVPKPDEVPGAGDEESGGADDEWNPDAVPPVAGYDPTDATPIVLVGSGVPAVVAVVVTRDPGPWLESTLAALDAQEYANLSTVVIDAASRIPTTPRVAEAFPEAFVKRIEQDTFAAAANAALGTIEGAVFYLFCHDDAELQPGAVQALVEEAFRSNAGIVGAKLVDWDDSERLRDIGSSVDKFGFAWPVADPDELDQAQHDAVREVFVTSTAAMLVRCDLFADLGGFATDINGSGEDLDLCWRARIAGARVVIMPAAVVRHREKAELGDPVTPSRRLALRHQARIVLANYSAMQLLRIIPQALVLCVAEMLVELARGRIRAAADVAGAVIWNVGHLPTTLRIRGQVKRSRRTDDREIRRLQVRGSARFIGFVRNVRASSDRLPAAWHAARDLPSSLSEGAGPWGFATAVFVVLVVLIGSRSLLSSGVPVVREFSLFDSPSAMIREWWSGWRSAGLGASGGTPSLLGVAGVASWVALGSTGLIRTLLVVSPLPLGAWGMWRLMRHVARPASRAAGVVVYLANPLPYNALAEGRWQALALYAAMPFVVARIARAGGWEPFDSPAMAPGTTQRQIADMGLTLGLAAVIAPSVIVLALVTAVALSAVMRLGAARGRPLHALGVTAGGALAAAVLHLPWTIDVVRSSARWIVMTGASDSAVGHTRLTSALRFATGSHGGVLSLLLICGSSTVLLVARHWRGRWAAAGAALGLLSFAAVVLVDRTASGSNVVAVESLLVPAAFGVAMLVTLGFEAFESDVLGGAFGWRQILSALAGVAVLVGCSPLLLDMLGGRWDAPESDLQSAIAPLGGPGDQQFRTLWIGDPDVLPLRGWSLRPGLDLATSVGVRPSVSSFAFTDARGGELQLRDSVNAAAAGETSRLGRLLAPFAVRYVVVVDRLAALPYGSVRTPVPPDVTGSLDRQLDLVRLDVAPGIAVYENLEAHPMRGVVAGSAMKPYSLAGIATLLAGGVPPASPAMESTSAPTGASGPIRTKGYLVVSQNLDAQWSLEVAGRSARPTPAFAWSSMFEVPRTGFAHLRYDPALSSVLEHVAQFVCLIGLFWFRRRRLFELRTRRVPGSTRRTVGRRSTSAGAVDGDEP